MQRIQVTSSELRDSASRMRATAGSVQDQLTQQMNNVQNLLSAEWTGDASAAFGGFYKEMNDGWSKVKDALENVAQMVDRSAQSYEDNEQAIRGQFQH